MTISKIFIILDSVENDILFAIADFTANVNNRYMKLNFTIYHYILF